MYSRDPKKSQGSGERIVKFARCLERVGVLRRIFLLQRPWGRKQDVRGNEFTGEAVEKRAATTQIKIP